MVYYGYAMGIQIKSKETLDTVKGRPLASNLVYVPSDVRVEGEKLTWTVPSYSAQTEKNWVRPTDRMLAAFVRLSLSDSAQPIERFARRYGVFGAYQVPPRLADSERDIFFDGKLWGISPARGSTESLGGRAKGIHWEPIALWKFLSETAVAVLRIAIALNSTPPNFGDPSDWEALGVPDFNPETAEIEDAQRFLELELNHWLAAGRVTLRAYVAEWNKLKTLWKTELYFPGGYQLFGALAVQLMLAVTGAESLYLCAGCRLPYIRTWKAPNPGSRNYCDDCGPKRALDDADKARKQKRLEARRLYSEAGLSIREIAQRLNTRHGAATVQRWVKGLRKGSKYGKKTR